MPETERRMRGWTAAALALVVVPLAWTAAYGVSRWSGLLRRNLSAASSVEAPAALREVRVHVSVRSIRLLRRPLEILFAPLIRLEEAWGPRRSEEESLKEAAEVLEAYGTFR